MNIEEWFKNIRERYSSQMQCGRGCMACCHGLFDISLADAVEVALADLRQDYNRIDHSQQKRSAAVAQQLKLSDHRVVTFIPSVIAEYDSFWKVGDYK